MVAAAVASLVVRLLVWVGEALVRWWPVVAVLALLGFAAGVWRAVAATREHAARARRLSVLRFSLAELDAMDNRQFEFALRDLLIRDGWSARQVGQQGDQAADVIADHPAYGRLVVQAKHTKVAAKVGSQVMYQVNGTAGPAHRANAATVVTNGGFTRDAREWGEPGPYGADLRSSWCRRRNGGGARARRTRASPRPNGLPAADPGTGAAGRTVSPVLTGSRAPALTASQDPATTPVLDCRRIINTIRR
ncbi:restriction endonuclease [Streptomyces sp. NPDC001930]|uniref:restriction endonuclease n=1 Tax=Streptomyces sp. NPDC001930 TaxID=3364625 RepID=UPI0036A22433